MLDLKAWVARRAEADDRLYERYGKALERELGGTLTAIGLDGRVILGDDDVAVAMEAMTQCGPGRFALRRVGYDAEIRWRRPSP